MDQERPVTAKRLHPLLGMLLLAISSVRGDFTIVMLPDTQWYTEVANPNRFDQQTQWIKAKRDSLDIVFVSHLGDIVNNPTDVLYQRASRSMAVLDGVVPYGIAPGNHDLDDGGGPGTRGTAHRFRQYFPVSRFSKQPGWGGYYESANPARNSMYHTFSADGMDFIILHLEWESPDDVLNWAKGVLQAHPNHRALITTHYYLNSRGHRDSTYPFMRAGGNQGEEIWQKLVRSQPNVFMVSNGHWGVEGRLTSLNDAGKPVHQVVTDYTTRPASKMNGVSGDGWLRYYTFRPSENKIYAYTYSPSLDRYESDPSSQFVLHYAMRPAVGAATIRVAACQMRVEDGRIEENLALAADFVQRAKAAGAHLCIFPELMDVGFGSIVKSRGTARLAFPIPGPTADRLGAIARKHGVWISAALLEGVAGGAYDTNVLIDPDGRVVHKQRKAFCYPSFAGTPCYQGNYHDVRAVPSPWGLLAVMNCADTNAKAKRALIAGLGPSLVLVNFANPQANLLRQCNALAAECHCPVVGTNMIFPPESKLRGGKSRVASAEGKTLWQAGDTEAMQVYELTVRVPDNLPPTVEAGDTQAVRLPCTRVGLRGRVLDDGRPGPLKTAWVKASGPGSVSFANASAQATDVTFSMPGVYILRLTAGDGALSASDAVAVTVLPADGSDPSLVGYWPFDGTADDRSGKGNHARLKGRAALVADRAPTGSPNAGALSLRGGGFAMVPHAPSLDARESVTVALWVKFRSLPPMWPTRQSGWVAFLSKGKWWKENYAIGVGEYFYLFARAYGEMNCPSLEKTVRETGRWHHVAAVFNAQERRGRIYIDGVLNHSIVNAPSAGTNAEPIYLGRFSHESASLDGLLDDVRVYARALADDEIAALVPGAKVNRPPAVEAGPDLSVRAAGAVHLKGSTRDDGAFPSSRTAGWTFWRKVAGPGDVSFEDPFAPATAATFTRQGRYILELRASDGAHLGADTASIVVE